ncbi:hypothetical protein AB3X94_41385 [Paraburkholderia sp. BR10923]|uniref:hypothetical protein n=1 Tax=Paraburkholderia sp. BR10923 TaxID=3236992 RepID=UPI0034CEB05D
MSDTRRHLGCAVVGVTANRHLHDGVHRDWLRRRYIEALTKHASLECVILPTIDRDLPCDAIFQRLRDVMRRLDGLVLTGDESDSIPGSLTGTVALGRLLKTTLSPAGRIGHETGCRWLR